MTSIGQYLWNWTWTWELLRLHLSSMMKLLTAAALAAGVVAPKALAWSLARHVTGVNPDTALFAGIIHEVGGFYLLSRADEFPGLLDDDPEKWGELCEDVVGLEVLKKLEGKVTVKPQGPAQADPQTPAPAEPQTAPPPTPPHR